MIQLFRRRTDDLENDLDASLFGICSGNGQRDAFSLFINSQDDELTRFCLSGNQRSFDLHLGHGRIEWFLA